MSLWNALKSFQTATEGFQKAISKEVPSDADLYGKICPCCIFNLDKAEAGTLEGLTAANPRVENQWNEFSVPGETNNLWKHCAVAFAQLVKALFESDSLKPSYYALLMDFDQQIQEELGGSNEPATSFTFAAFDHDPTKGTKAISDYLTNGLSTTALLYELAGQSQPITIAWKNQPDTTSEESESHAGNLSLSFVGEPIGLTENIPKALSDPLTKLTGAQVSDKLAEKVAGKYAATIKGYRAHIENSYSFGTSKCTRFLGVFLPAAGPTPRAAAFFLFDLSNSTDSPQLDRLLLFSHVLSGSLNDWQKRLKELLLPSYTKDAVTNRILHQVAGLARRTHPTSETSVNKCFCGHDHIQENAAEYATLVHQLYSNGSAETDLSKAMFRLNAISNEGSEQPWPAIEYYLGTSADCFHDRSWGLEEFRGIVSTFISPLTLDVEGGQFSPPCTPALPWLLAMRSLLLQMMEENDAFNGQALLKAQETIKLSSRSGQCRLTIPIHFDASRKHTLRSRYHHKSKSGPPKPGISGAIQDVLHARVRFEEMTLRDKNAIGPVHPVFKLYERGTSQPVCSVLIWFGAIHFFWAITTTPQSETTA